MHIFVTPEGYVKEADHGLSNELKNAYLKMLLTNCAEKCTISPEELDYVYSKTRLEDTQFNQFKADVFSLGMTILHMATLTPAETVYDFVECQILNAKVEALLAQV
jgi:hypothetical protein